jgi:hypothetical protein
MIDKLLNPLEDGITRFWDRALRNRFVLGGMGRSLNGISGARAWWNRSLEDAYAGWRLPSALDVERMHDRIGDLEAHILRLERALSQRDEA